MADARRWSRAAVARATGMPVRTLERLCDRGIIRLGEGDSDTRGSGEPRGFGLRSVYRVAIIAALMSAGIPPRRASSAASVFADGSQCGRARGECFDNPSGTLLLVSSNTARCLNASPSTIARTLLNDGLGNPQHGTVVIDVSALRDEVDARLGI